MQRRAGGTDHLIPDTNPLNRPIGEIQRPTHVVDIFPNEHAITRLVWAVRLEQNDESAVRRARYVSLETIAPLSDDPVISCEFSQADSPANAGDRGDSTSPATQLPRTWIILFPNRP